MRSIHFLGCKVAGVLARVALLFVVALLHAQNTLPVRSDAQASNLAAQSTLALTGGAAITDAVLAGQATQVIGDTQTGSVVLKVSSNGSSRIDLSLSGGTRSEVHLEGNGLPSGQWKNADGKTQKAALHNHWSDAAWTFPAFTFLARAKAPGVACSYQGLEIRLG